MTCDLFCVQPYMQWQDYLSADAFYRKIERYFQWADAQRVPEHPALIVFPEDIATFLLLVNHAPILEHASSLTEAFALIGHRYRRNLLVHMVKYRTASVKRAFFLYGAPTVWRIWYRTMTALARQYHITVVAGSALLPDHRAGSDQDTLIPASARIYNRSLTIGPDGQVLSAVKKVNLVPTQEDVLDLSPGPLEQALTAAVLPGTSIRLATAICYDGFRCPHTPDEPHFINLVPWLDRLGVRILAQPSANPWPWDEPFALRPGTALLRREQWHTESAISQLADCQSIEVLINAHLLMDVLDVHFDGQSVIARRTPAGVEILARSPQTQGPGGECVLLARWSPADG